MDNPLDQYFMRHPEDFFQKSFENALINPENPYILRAHLACAAWEMPLGEHDDMYFGATLQKEIAGDGEAEAAAPAQRQMVLSARHRLSGAERQYPLHLRAQLCHCEYSRRFAAGDHRVRHGFLSGAYRALSICTRVIPIWSPNWTWKAGPPMSNRPMSTIIPAPLNFPTCGLSRNTSSQSLRAGHGLRGRGGGQFQRHRLPQESPVDRGNHRGRAAGSAAPDFQHHIAVV